MKEILNTTLYIITMLSFILVIIYGMPKLFLFIRHLIGILI